MTVRMSSFRISVLVVAIACFGLAAPASAIPVRELPGLASITFYERTGGLAPTPYVFTVNGPQLTTRRASPLSGANHDIPGATSEYYDVYYSDVDGNFDIDGEYLTISGVFQAGFPLGGGWNLAEMALNFEGGPSEFGRYVASFVALGDNAAEPDGNVELSVDGDLQTHTTMGNTVGAGPEERLRITLGFVASYDPANFLARKAKTASGGERFYKFGPLAVETPLSAGNVDVLKFEGLLVPAARDGEAVSDANTSLAAYKVKASKGAPKPSAPGKVEVSDACGSQLLDVGVAARLLVPSDIETDEGAEVPVEARHNLDQYLCFAAKTARKDAEGNKLEPLPKGIQADVEDVFGSARYDLKKVTALCLPTTLAGDPVVLAGPDKTLPVPVAAASVRNPGSALLCYQSKLATSFIEQGACGPLVAGDEGEKFDPRQEKPAKQPDLSAADLLRTSSVDAGNIGDFCVPATVGGGGD